MAGKNGNRDAATPSPGKKAEPKAEKNRVDPGERHDKPGKGDSRASQDRARNERSVKEAQQRGSERRQPARVASDKAARAGQAQGAGSQRLARESADAKAARPAEKRAAGTPEKHGASSSPGGQSKKQRETSNPERQKQLELERLAKDPSITDQSVQERIGGKVRSSNGTSAHGNSLRLVVHSDDTGRSTVLTVSNGRGWVHTSARTSNGGRTSGYEKTELHGHVILHESLKGFDGSFKMEFWTRERDSRTVEAPGRLSFQRSEKSVSHGRAHATVDKPKAGGLPEKNLMPRPERGADGKAAPGAQRHERAPQLREHDGMAAHAGKSLAHASATGVAEPGPWESLIPVWGSGRQAIHDFQQGHYGWGTFNGLLAVSDLFLVGTLGKGLVKGGLRLGFKANSQTWNAARKWYGKYYSRFSPLPKYTQVHHVFLHRGTRYRWLPDAIENAVKNHPLNLKPILATQQHSSQALHTYIHHGSNPAKRWWLGYPGWAKTGSANIPGHLTGQARSHERGPTHDAEQPSIWLP